MTIEAIAIWLQSSTLASLVDGSRYIAMTVQAFHLLGLTFLLALVLVFNLRALRLTLPTLPLARLAHVLHIPYLLLLTVTILAGILLFMPRAGAYTNNEPFVWKMGLLLLAGCAQLLQLRKATSLAGSSELNLNYRTLSGLTIVLWLSTGVAGRTIGFV